MSAKGILKNNMKDLKLQGKSLIFDPACVSTKTKTGHFLTGREIRQPFTKKIMCFEAIHLEVSNIH